jgi:hypothetical protein
VASYLPERPTRGGLHVHSILQGSPQLKETNNNTEAVLYEDMRIYFAINLTCLVSLNEYITVFGENC